MWSEVFPPCNLNHIYFTFQGWFVFLLTVCLAADIYAENQDDANLIDNLFEQEVDIYNLGKAGK